MVKTPEMNEPDESAPTQKVVQKMTTSATSPSAAVKLGFAQHLGGLLQKPSSQGMAPKMPTATVSNATKKPAVAANPHTGSAA